MMKSIILQNAQSLKEIEMDQRGERILHALKLKNRDYYDALKLKRHEKIKSFFPGTSQHYKISQSRWAGGEHYTYIDIVSRNQGELEISGKSNRVFSSNGKWSGNNSAHNIEIYSDYKKRVADNNIEIVGDLITLDAKKIAHREYQASWIEQGRGFDLNIASGYIIRGFHSKKTNYQDAVNQAQKSRAKTMTILLKSRAKRQQLTQDFSNVFVQRSDSLSVGNCKEGTKNFIKNFLSRQGWGECAVRGDILLKYQDNIWTRRALTAAQNR